MLKESYVESNPTREQLLEEAWSQGILEYLVDDYQLPIYAALWKAILNKTTLKHVLNVARRFGKTHVVTIVAFEFAIRFPGAQINYASATDKAMKKILSGIVPVILQDCPQHLKPKRVNGTWEFPNGSRIYTAGVNNQHADDLRGTASHLNIVDEAGMVDDLDYLVKSVLMPQQLTVNGTMLLLSTPPPSSDHDYARIYHEAKEDGEVTEFTIYDNARVMANKEMFDAYVKEAGGLDSTTWQREYLVKFVSDTNKIILPEWLLVKDKCIKTDADYEYDRLKQYYLKYTGMDLGFKHNTCLLFGYADFQRGVFVIEDELVLNGTDVTSEAIATGTLEVESRLWDKPKSLMRISDNNNPILLNDINVKHNVLFNGTTKDSLQAMIGQTRLFIGQGKLEVHERCKYLLGCLEYGVWDKNRAAFAESRKYGHYDALAALVYLLRYVDFETNPVPKNLDIASVDLLMPVIDRGMSISAEGLSNWTRINRRTLRQGAS